MKNNQDILQELKSISLALIPLQGINVFTVPFNYFQQFNDELLNEIREDISLLPFAGINRMEVPAGYFDSLASNILSKIKSLETQSVLEELKELSPALSATGNDNVFSIPTRYFQDLPEIILSRVHKPAIVVSMRTRSSFVKYAAAAVVSGILGLSLFSVLNNKTNIESSPLTASVVTDAKKIIQSNSFDKTLETISDEEIVGYLKNNGLDVNAALVASATETKELPAADDYIINDNTLNNFLDELNINQSTN